MGIVDVLCLMYCVDVLRRIAAYAQLKPQNKSSRTLKTNKTKN